MKPRSLVSVSDKRGLDGFARGLVELGFEIVSTGGTAQALRELAVPVVEVSELTGTPEVLGGRVKTLHPHVFASILADLDDATHRAVLDEWGLGPIALVAVNLYPFVATAARPGVAPQEVIENIDIGGPSLLRAAAKNHRHVTVVVDPDDYGSVLEALRAGGPGEQLRRQLAIKAFRHTAAYDAAIAQKLPRHLGLEP
ncbi:MAG: bifunctional phosphoribosylaminoimidazolecarboxamide formyltransferase/IMP cyclohydrolase, partial [Thermoanaerobaculaceae bacterium]|nr:bifunctional phosphoribosylaminoimidazolecarboxamide formyltransferase/IMP cyclohydrolase [Thermoanaerobaculaceae bacterium]